MKMALTIASAVMLAWTSTLVWAASPSPETLAEMKKCAVCKELASHPTLLEEMTWETHKIENGMLCVASVPKEHAKEFAAIQFLEGIIKSVVPFINPNADVDIAEIERDDGEKKSSRGPFLLRPPVGLGQSPSVTHHMPL